MPTIEERLAFLEGRVTEHSRGMDGLREALSSLELRMDRRFEALESRVTGFESRVDRRFDELDSKLTRYFVWMIGIIVTSLSAMVAALATMAAKL